VKRVLRILLSVAVPVSLVLFLFLPVGWFRSYFSLDYLSFPVAGRHLQLGWATGCVFGWIGRTNSEPVINSYPPVEVSELFANDTQFHHIGRFAYLNSTGGFGLFAPFWIAMFIAAIPPAAWLRSRRTRKSPDPGMCPKCGYDLRASKDRCPECGHRIPNQTCGAGVPPAP
jgi:hypothetical protein